MRGFAAVVFTMLFFLSRSGCAEGVERDSLRILHVMSYNAEWQWNKDQFQGFSDAMIGVSVTYKFIELDTHNTGDEATARRAAEDAVAAIEGWKPHLVYANDDRAQQHVTKRYVGSAVPFVYSAVNADPASYGLSGASNVTGVLEREHFAATIALLRRLVPAVRRIAIVFDEDPTWTGVLERIRLALPSIPGLQVIDWAEVRTFEEYKQRVTAYQTTVDAFAPLGVFHFKDNDGGVVSHQEVLRWTAENSRLPDFAFWDSRVELGTLVAVTVSGYEQGFLAGKMARQILVDGIPPSAVPVQASRKGRPAISLVRARKLGINVDSTTLLAARVVTDFAWER